MDLTVLSSITNKYDSISEKQIFTCPYVMFSDLESENWKVKPPFKLFEDSNRNAKIPKVLSHKFSGEYSLWIDGNIEILVDPTTLVEKYLDGFDICFFNHPLRHCAYSELDLLKNGGYDSGELMDRQMSYYAKENYPRENGLQAGSVILRRHTPQVVAFNNMWWSEITTGSRRDQLSLDYCLWKTGLKPNHFPGYHQAQYGGSDLFVSHNHN